MAPHYTPYSHHLAYAKLQTRFPVCFHMQQIHCVYFLAYLKAMHLFFVYENYCLTWTFAMKSWIFAV